MKCPRCGAQLREILPSPKMLRHFDCDECYLRYHLEFRGGWTLVIEMKERNRV